LDGVGVKFWCVFRKRKLGWVFHGIWLGIGVGGGFKGRGGGWWLVLAGVEKVRAEKDEGNWYFVVFFPVGSGLMEEFS